MKLVAVKVDQMQVFAIVGIMINADVNVKRNGYRIHFWYMSKNDAISIMNNSNLIDEMDVL